MEFFKGVNWALLRQKKVQPPSKLNPVFDSASIKTEFFDPEYLLMNPRLSLIEEDGNCD